MAETIQFSSSISLPTQYGSVIVPTSETDAIIIKGLDVDSASVAEVGANTQGTLYIDFTKGSLTNVAIKFYGSYVANPAATDWYQEVVETDSTGVATLDPFSIVLTATAKIAFHVPIGAYRTFKITVTGTGTATNSLLKLNFGLRNN